MMRCEEAGTGIICSCVAESRSLGFGGGLYLLEEESHPVLYTLGTRLGQLPLLHHIRQALLQQACAAPLPPSSSLKEPTEHLPTTKGDHIPSQNQATPTG